MIFFFLCSCKNSNQEPNLIEKGFAVNYLNYIEMAIRCDKEQENNFECSLFLRHNSILMDEYLYDETFEVYYPNLGCYAVNIIFFDGQNSQIYETIKFYNFLDDYISYRIVKEKDGIYYLKFLNEMNIQINVSAFPYDSGHIIFSLGFLRNTGEFETSIPGELLSSANKDITYQIIKNKLFIYE